MFKDISVSDFIDEFKNSNRETQFSFNGLKALYDYLTELEDDTGEKIELDVIALCCDYVEYEDIEQYIKDYNTQIDKADFSDPEEFKKAVIEEITEKTTFIKVDEDAFIIQSF